MWINNQLYVNFLASRHTHRYKHICTHRQTHRLTYHIVTQNTDTLYRYIETIRTAIHTTQTHITDRPHRHILQTYITDTYHRHISQTYITDRPHRHISQRLIIDRHTLQNQICAKWLAGAYFPNELMNNEYTAHGTGALIRHMHQVFAFSWAGIELLFICGFSF